MAHHARGAQLRAILAMMTAVVSPGTGDYSAHQLSVSPVAIRRSSKKYSHGGTLEKVRQMAARASTLHQATIRPTGGPRYARGVA